MGKRTHLKRCHDDSHDRRRPSLERQPSRSLGPHQSAGRWARNYPNLCFHANTGQGVLGNGQTKTSALARGSPARCGSGNSAVGIVPGRSACACGAWLLALVVVRVVLLPVRGSLIPPLIPRATAEVVVRRDALAVALRLP